MIKLFRLKFVSRPGSMIVALAFVFQLAYPAIGFALTSGPSQPEIQSFEPVSTTQMVDPFTGDFTYNIPLLDVGGYPVNISYHAGVKMDQEASWVGLGWNINPGVINRSMRGVPDDFKGDQIEKRTNIKPMVQVGFDPLIKNKLKQKDEIVGFPVDAGGGSSIVSTGMELEEREYKYEIYYNNYKGVGYRISRPGGLFSFGYDSQEGIAVTLGHKFKKEFEKKDDKTIETEFSVSMGYSTREGLGEVEVEIGYSKSKEAEHEVNCHKFKQEDDYDRGGSVTYEFASEPYTPVSRPNQFSYNYKVDLKFYNDKTASTDPRAKINAHIDLDVNVTGVKDNTETFNAFGFLNEHLADKYALTDLNTEGGPVKFDKETSNLRPAINTFDVMGLSGQGVGGVYKPVKNYVSVSAEPFHNMVSLSKISVPFELGYSQLKEKASKDAIPSVAWGKAVKVGLDPTLVFVWGENGLWTTKDGNESIEKFDMHRKADHINTLNEKVYYKNSEEKTVYDQTFLNLMDYDKAVKLKINSDKYKLNIDDNQNALPILSDDENEIDISTNGVKKLGRGKRSEVISYLSAVEADKFGLEKKIFTYSYDPGTKLLNRAPLDRVNGFRKSHHISEITSLTSDGSRYVYGLPMYNYESFDQTFNIGAKDAVLDYFKQGTISYDGTDDGMGNSKGIDKYFHEEKMPSYAHSWMLTAVLSPDYVDVTGDGPSNDDLGGYTKFNYQKLILGGGIDDETNLYDWRFPYKFRTGHFNRAFKCDDEDDRATVMKGRKEVWYLQSIETKTHIAIFHTSSRQDGFDASKLVTDPRGDMVLKKLDKIELFDIVDFYANPQTRIPVKTVNFAYSYDLCGDVFNNSTVVTGNGTHPLNSYNGGVYFGDLNKNKGKLTLHKIWFTYGNGTQGIQSPYIFEYKNINPSYEARSVDRWGNYKPWNYESGLTGAESYAGNAQATKTSNAEYPFVPQGEALVNTWAGVWNLTDIKMPSGGKLQIEYEADDYAFVQDKEAMQMYKVAGFSVDQTSVTAVSHLKNELYGPVYNSVNQFLWFKWPTGKTENEVYRDLETVFGSFFVTLNPNNKPLGYSSRKEHIQVYMEIEEKGSKTLGAVKYGFIKVKPEKIDERSDPFLNIHPVTKESYQFMREEASHLAYPGSNVKRGNSTFGQIFGSVFSFIPELARTVAGFDKYHLKKEYGKEVYTENSFIRLMNPDSKKKGGGHRVKKIKVSDNWKAMTLDPSTMTDEEDLVTGQEFDYTVIDPDRKSLEQWSSGSISTGVASYEPLVGGNENPWKDRIQFDDGSFTAVEKKLFAPDNFKYEEGPIGESFFPDAMVGYSKVTVKKIKPDGVDPNRLKMHGTGRQEYEFYTAKDFPTLTSRTSIDVHIRENIALRLFGYHKEKATATQGFLIELNDMHGKLKAIKNYAETGDIVVSGTTYDYLVEDDDPGKLVNHVDVLDKTGQKLSNKPVGIEAEVFCNAIRDEHNSLEGSAQINATFIFPNSGIPPVIPLITAMPSLSYERIVVQEITFTKVLQRFGLLKTTTYINEGSSLATINEAWDAETGEVILKRAENEYGNWNYNIAKPAHWVEAGMSGAYANIGAEVLLKTTASPGEVQIANLNGFGSGPDVASIQDILYPGDELIAVLNPENLLDVANGPGDDRKFWVLSVGTGTANLIDISGNPIPGNLKPYYFKIARSGHRNLLRANAEVLTMQSDPSATTNWGQLASLNNVIDGSALLYSDQWQTYYQKEMKARLNCEFTQNPYYEEVPSDPMAPMFMLNTGAITDFANATAWPEYKICSGKKYFAPGDFANPFVLGVRGVWRPWFAMSYYDKTNAKAERTQNWTGGNPNQIDLRTSGLIQDYVPFYQLVSGKWTPQWTPSSPTPHDKWTWQEKSMMVGPNGEEVQNQDALNMYSSALYGYQKTLPTAVCQNSKYEEMLFDGFEEYSKGYFYVTCGPDFAGNLAYYPVTFLPFFNTYKPNDICNNTWHWPLWKSLANGNSRISTDKAHTGKQSMVVSSPYTSVILDNNNALTGSYVNSGGRFFLNPSDFIPVFYPKNTSLTAPSYYVLTYWMYGNGNIQAKDAAGTILATSQIGSTVTIDGWTRYEFKVTLPANTSINEIKFFNNNTSYINNGSTSNPIITQYMNTVSVIKPVYYDDIRLFPYSASMKSYVYDKTSKKLMASLSENNFATFYEYDNEGNMVRTKVETVKGIMTTKESRGSTRKK